MVVGYMAESVNGYTRHPVVKLPPHLRHRDYCLWSWMNTLLNIGQQHMMLALSTSLNVAVNFDDCEFSYG
jgi:hypothetical protein